MKLPVDYRAIDQRERREVRNEYVRLQRGKCQHCLAPLSGEPLPEIKALPLNLRQFPDGFLRHPVHLHHDHKTGMTIGAVHAYCNGVLWQYHGE